MRYNVLHFLNNGFCSLDVYNLIGFISKLQPTRCNFSCFIYFYRRSTCFRRFLRPSSGAHNCAYSFRYCQPILLLAATVDEMERSSISSTVAAPATGRQHCGCIIPQTVTHSLVLLKMGKIISRNMLS